jgi:hypothetical protein
MDFNLYSLGSTSDFIITFIVNRLNKLEQKVKPAVSELLQKCRYFLYFPPENLTCYLVSGEVFVTKEILITSLFDFYLCHSRGRP